MRRFLSLKDVYELGLVLFIKKIVVYPELGICHRVVYTRPHILVKLSAAIKTVKDSSVVTVWGQNDLHDPERGMMIVCSATHKTKSMFFFLVQTEQVDIFRVKLEVDDDVVTELKMKYFDTVPVASSLCVLKTGFLFVPSEFGNHLLYQIAHLGDDDMSRSSPLPCK